jgi:pimeloyl-ACP methyl ester carboxylesterase
MPEAFVRGVRINYDVIGKSGSWIALTPGSRRAFAELVPMAGRFAEQGFRVLLHDRRNCGASEVGIEALGSEHEIWADDLYALCGQLGALPIYAGGSSAGARLALLFALRHPGAVKGLLLWRVTGGSLAAEELAETYYGSFVEMAKSGGMEAVCRSEHFAECIRARPSNRERLMRMDTAEFIEIMGMWRRKFLEAANMPVIGATEAQLRSMTVPVCLIAGNDRIHSPATARKVKSLIANSELHEDVVEKRASDDLLPEWDRKEWSEKEGIMARIFVDFIRRAEASQLNSAVAR